MARTRYLRKNHTEICKRRQVGPRGSGRAADLHDEHANEKEKSEKAIFAKGKSSLRVLVLSSAGLEILPINKLLVPLLRVYRVGQLTFVGSKVVFVQFRARFRAIAELGRRWFNKFLQVSFVQGFLPLPSTPNVLPDLHTEFVPQAVTNPPVQYKECVGDGDVENDAHLHR